MPMAHPVLRDDAFAGPAWNACITLLALEKIQTGEELTDDERKALGKTVEFIGSLRETPRDDDLSQEANRSRSFRRWNGSHRPFDERADIRLLHLQLQALARQLEPTSAPGEEVLVSVPEVVSVLLTALDVINCCRRL